MVQLARQHWPVILTLLLCIGASIIVQMNVTFLQSLLVTTPPAVSVMLFVLIGIVLVMIPAASILPLMPLAVSMWGWPAAAALTLVAWVLGGQILFEAARKFGRPLVGAILTGPQLRKISHLVETKNIFHLILVRVIVHGDLVSYAFGLFSSIPRMEYLVVSVVGVAPAAVAYAYFGSLPAVFQLVIGIVIMVAGVIYLTHLKLPKRFSKAIDRMESFA